MSIGLLISAWLVGALGGLHCIAMCGGFMGAIAARDAAGAMPLRAARAIVISQAGSHAGRLFMYAIIGALFGALGATLIASIDLLPLQRATYAIANALLLVLGAGLMLRMPALPMLQRLGMRAFAPLLRAIRPLLRRSDALGRVAMGLIWGLMPCALIYSALPMALVAGGWWQGALVLAAFGLGTLPNLMATGLALGRARRLLATATLRNVAALALIAFGTAGLWRVLAAPETRGRSPFCF